MAKPILTHAELLRVLDYNPETGLFYWRVRLGARGNPGSVAGSSTDQGYRMTRIGGKRYLLHRLAVFYTTGEWPTTDVDHINRDRSDNRWSNLRVVTHAQNHQNRAVGRANKSGSRGVCWAANDRRWRASITVGGKSVYLGNFKEKEDAIAAREHAERKMFTHSPLSV